MAKGDMIVAADTHVHGYPRHDLAVLFDAAMRALARAAGAPRGAAAFPPGACGVLCFTDAAADRGFARLRAAVGKAPPAPGLVVEALAEPEALRLRRADGAALHAIGGFQVVTRERLEVLALGAREAPPGGRALDDTVRRVREAGAVPVLPWAPGKWLGGRGRAMRRFVEESSPGDFVLADSRLRPTVWPEPAILRLARDRGFKIVAGSDPLAPSADAAAAGSYATVYRDVPFDEARPAVSMRALLAGADGRRAGRRIGPLALLRLLRRHAAAMRG